MKHLVLLRHAKSDWNSQSLNDIERPLNHRGKNDATLIGQYLANNVAIPQEI